MGRYLWLSIAAVFILGFVALFSVLQFLDWTRGSLSAETCSLIASFAGILVVLAGIKISSKFDELMYKDWVEEDKKDTVRQVLDSRPSAPVVKL